MTNSYLMDIYKSRYFWINLARLDLITKFRRSKLGVLWAILQPLLFTLLFAFVFGTIFKATNISEYIPYVFSGIVIWESITSSAIQGCHAIINAEAYIKQHKYPILIYPLRTILANYFTLFYALFGLFLYVFFWRAENLYSLSILSLPFALFLLFLISLPLGIITSFINLQFRDFQQMIALLFQAIWYVSPIFFESKVFLNSQLQFLIHYNPVYHMLELFRAPLLHANFPTIDNYIYTIGSIAILSLIAFVLTKSREKKAIFYL